MKHVHNIMYVKYTVNIKINLISKSENGTQSAKFVCIIAKILNTITDNLCTCAGLCEWIKKY